MLTPLVLLILNSYTSSGNTITTSNFFPTNYATGTTLSTLNNGATLEHASGLYLRIQRSAYKLQYQSAKCHSFSTRPRVTVIPGNSFSPTNCLFFRQRCCVSAETPRWGLKYEVLLLREVWRAFFSMCVCVKPQRSQRVLVCYDLLTCKSVYAYLYPDNTAIDFASNMTTFVQPNLASPTPPYDTKTAHMLIASNEQRESCPESCRLSGRNVVGGIQRQLRWGAL